MKTATKSVIAKRYGISYSGVHNWATMPDFPKPIKLKGKVSNPIYSLPEVDKWVSIHRPRAVIKLSPREKRQVQLLHTEQQARLNQDKANHPVNSKPEPIKPSRLSLINYILKDDPEKQRLVLDLLLD